jgi:phenylacetic acid degradation operon negative regulatory protein
VLDGLGLQSYVRVFHGVPGEPTDPAQLVADAYDLEPLAQRYVDFVARWQTGSTVTPVSRVSPASRTTPAPGPSAQDDPLTRRVVLLTDWLQVVREDPRLPVSFLPPGWPSVAAEQLFRRLSRELQPAAEAAVRHQIETIPATG